MKVSPKQYAHALFDLTQGKEHGEINTIITDFVARVKKNGHLRFSHNIIAQFEKIYNNAHSIITATVTSAFPLQNAQKDVLEKYIMDTYHAKKIIATYCEDKNVRGGVVIRVGDEVLDASVDGRLRMITHALLN